MVVMALFSVASWRMIGKSSVRIRSLMRINSFLPKDPPGWKEAKSSFLNPLLSDGDLRRALMKEDFSLNDKAITYANTMPTYYTNTELLASEALEIIEKGKIQLLPITTEAKKIIGVLHIHDLINAGIKSK